MSKLKTKKGVAKRFRMTKKGKIKYAHGGKSHLGTQKEPERLRKLRRSALVRKRGQNIKYLKRMLPYG
jgi:large subunit ribosomal protein L35